MKSLIQHRGNAGGAAALPMLTNELDDAVFFAGADHQIRTRLDFGLGIADGNGYVCGGEHLKIVDMVAEDNDLSVTESVVLGERFDRLVFCRPAVMDCQPVPAGEILVFKEMRLNTVSMDL
jgi:hypothetical protein